MPKKQSLEVRLYCLKCKDYTQSIEPIVVYVYHIEIIEEAI